MRAGQSVKRVSKSIRTRLKVPTDTPTRGPSSYGPGPPRFSASAPGTGVMLFTSVRPSCSTKTTFSPSGVSNDPRGDRPPAGVVG
jgi:hypothetical protein